tara:strand:- start:1801 stop:4953 length:3153 start_codon:yes stop_codon:yes gene_type:complete
VPEIEDIYPLSPTQQGLLFHSLLAPGAGLYVPQIVLSLSGKLDAERLQAAWNNAVQRHTVLRTGFQWEQRDEPFQVVYSAVDLGWTELDWSAFPKNEQTTKLQAFLAANRSEPFNLHRPPLFRVHLIRCSADTYYLVWAYHHLLLDGWSASRVLQEVLQDYLVGRGIQPPRTRYAEYIAWQRKQDVAAAENFWTKYLGDDSAEFARSLPDNGTHQERSTGIGEEVLELTVSQTGQLKSFAKDNGLTMNTLLLGAFGLLLNRARDSRDIILGTTIAGRPAALPGANEMVGLFINTLPVRIRVSPDQSTDAWLRRLQEQLAEANAHDYVSLRDIQSWVNQGRPLFDCLFVFESYPVSMNNAGQSGDLTLDAVDFDEWTHLPLTLLASEGESLVIKAKFQEPRVDAEHTRQLLDRAKCLLLEFANEPQKKLGNVSPITKADRPTIREWNNTAVDWPDQNVTLVDLLNRHAADENEAVRFTGESWQSYSSVHAHADHLAHLLLQAGVGREHQVTVHLQRCAELPTALLGILKANAAYVPLDTSYPQLRLQTILDEVQPTAFITDSRQGLPELETNARVIDLATLDLESPGTLSDSGKLDPQNPAYVIYTSGSTGRPKGVINTHAAIVNRLLWMQERYQLNESDRVLQKTPIGFDVSVWEFFWPLISGAKLVLAEPERHKDGAYLVAVVQSEEITTLHFVPPMLDAFLEVDGVEDCKSLRRIICSGDTLTESTQKACLRKLPHVELHNLYGPTEAAIDVTAWHCGEDHGATVPIGYPIANTTIHILDRDLNEVPIGEEGELYIGGSGLARGYLNRPALTAERFLPNPFQDSSEFLYQTGDRARYRTDGAIEFLGRADYQVKIRGQRIELAEIDAALLNHQAVGQSISIVQKPDDSEAEIVSYVTLNSECDPDAEIRPFLKSHLTAAMIPRHIMVLPELKLTANGKIDRSALPAPAAAPRREQLAPVTDTEKAIAAIWQEVLKLDQVGRNENFFELGGHSLSATRVNTRFRKILEIDLELRELFEYPVLEQLAKHADALRVNQKTETNEAHVEIEI